MTAARWAATVMAMVGLSACASTSPAGARSEVAEVVDRRAEVGDAIAIEQDEEARAEVRARVEELLSEPLTPDRAVRTALLNNRDFQAHLEQLGVAQSELVASGLLENPVIAGDLVVSTKGFGLGGGLSLSQSLLSVFLIPAKRRLAKSRLQHAVVSLAHASLVLIRDVKVAFYEAQASHHVAQLQLELLQVAEVADQLAARQLEAGNITRLDKELYAAALDEAKVAAADADLDAHVARERLNALLGLWGSEIGWEFAGSIREDLPDSPELRQLEHLGVEQRLDLSAAQFEVAAMKYAIGLRRRGFVAQVDGEFVARNEVGNDEGHEWVLGPGLALELPLFDPGHADFARLRALLRQAEHQRQELAVRVRSEIRVDRARIVAAQRKVDYYRETMLPRSESVADLTLRQYNGMLVGTYQLLETRADKTRTRREYVEAVRDYWIARSDLELAVGGELPATASGPR